MVDIRHLCKSRPHCGCAGHNGDAPFGDRLHRTRRIESFDQHDGSARGDDAAEHHVETEDVKHRQHTERDIGWVHGCGTECLRDVREQIPVREHRRPRCPGGSAREDQHRKIFGVHHRLGHFGTFGDQPIERNPTFRIVLCFGGRIRSDHLLDRRHVVGGEALPYRHRGWADDDDLCRYVIDFAFEFIGRCGWVQWHGHRTHADGCEIGNGKMPPIGGKKGHAVAAAHTDLLQAAAEAPNLGCELTVRRWPASTDDRNGIGGVAENDRSKIVACGHWSPDLYSMRS